MSLASDREQSRVIKEDEDDEVSKIDDVNSRYAACPTKSETGTVNIYSNHPTSKQGAGLPQRERERETENKCSVRHSPLGASVQNQTTRPRRFSVLGGHPSEALTIPATVATEEW